MHAEWKAIKTLPGKAKEQQHEYREGTCLHLLLPGFPESSSDCLHFLELWIRFPDAIWCTAVAISGATSGVSHTSVQGQLVRNAPRNILPTENNNQQNVVQKQVDTSRITGQIVPCLHFYQLDLALRNLQGCIKRLEVLKRLPLVKSPALQQLWWCRCSGDRVPHIFPLTTHCSGYGLKLDKAADFSHQLLWSTDKFYLSSSPTVSCSTQQLSALGGAHSSPALTFPKLIYSILAGNSRSSLWFPLQKFNFSALSLLL